MEHRKADVRQMGGHSTSGDDPARFLQELRQLRDGAGLGHAELAARAHYPYDSIRAAEVGPSLPDLPVLSAFVRGCGGTTEEWEERWRSLTRSPSLPVPAARTAGVSAAATAGARIGAVAQDADNPDPSIIIAALNRVAEDMATASQSEVAGPGTPGPAASPVLPGSPVAPAAPAVPGSPARPPVPVFPPAAAGGRAPSGPAASDFTAPADPLGDRGARPGWDPIRVSTAWPALPDTSDGDAPAGSGTGGSAAGKRGSGRAAGSRRGAAARPATSGQPSGPGSADPAGDVAAPWGTAPWTGDPAGAAPASSPATAGRAATTGRGAHFPGRSQAPGTGASTTGASRTRIVVVALVLLCVLAVLLAVFV